MFAGELSSHEIVLQEGMIGSWRYSSPYWFSDWCIFNLLYGRDDTPFIRALLPTTGCTEITEDDLTDVEQQIKHLNESCPPIHDIDKEALEDSQRPIADGGSIMVTE